MNTTASNKLSRAWVNPFSVTTSLEQRIFFLLRLGVMGCFVGHGAWGVITKAGWLPFFQVFFISEKTAYSLMPLIGAMDIIVGLLIFFRPTRALIVWAVFWTVFTAFLRPSAGMGMSEFFERAGNFGIPAALLLLFRLPKTRREWFAPLDTFRAWSPELLKQLEWMMRITVFLLLAGHGGLAYFMHSPNITKHFASLGINADITLLSVFGIFEMALGVVALLWPRLSGLMLFIVFYKLATELLFPYSGVPRDFLETFERMGDYVAPLVLWNIYRSKKQLI